MRSPFRLSSLHIKLWRELWQMKGQALAIMLVIVSGVGVCVMSLSAYDSLLSTRDSYYRDAAFAHVFANVKRAPESIVSRVREIPGVTAVETRVVSQVNLEVPGFSDPVSGLLTSTQDSGENHINRLHLVSGRLPDSRRDDEVVISSAFANAQRLTPGSSISAVINGRYRRLQIVGVALSPEYIYQIAPGSIYPDYERFGVLWMSNRAIATAFDMQGAFNSLVLRVQPGINPAGIMKRLDLLLARYGAQGAYGRDEQLSNQFLREEFSQLQAMAFIFPVIFLGVAIFLLNVVLTRLISAQREVIAVLKAFGYSNHQIGWHYAAMVLAISALGILGGYALGMWLGVLLTELYTQYFRFPNLLYTPRPTMFIGVALLTLVASLFGTLRTVLRAASLPPAQAMHPETPSHFTPTWPERWGLDKILSPPSKMVLRHLQNKPLKTLSVILGLAMATAIMMVGNFQQDSVNLMMHAQYKLAAQQDIDVTLYEPVSEATLRSFRTLPGVAHAEGTRVIPVKLQYQQRTYRTSLQGLKEDSKLQQVLDLDLKSIELPEQGLMVTEHLANKLGFTLGDEVLVETLEGEKLIRPMVVTRLSQQYMNLGAYMRLENVNRLMREGPAINRVLLTLEPGEIDPERIHELYRRLREMPAVAGIGLRQAEIDSFHNTIDQTLLVFIFINSILGGVIAFGVVYNTVRISLAEKARELASLRVLGYTRGEVAYILLGELVVVTLLSLLPGFLIGAELCQIIADKVASDLYRMPLVLTTYNYTFAALIVIVSATASALLVLYKLNQMNLVDVLKTRE